MRSALILAIALSCSASTFAQTPPRDPKLVTKEATAILRGRLVGADTGAPIRETVVSLAAVSGGTRGAAVYTDGNGQFEFTVPPGEYRLSVVPGSASARYLPLADSAKALAQLPVYRVNDHQVLDGIEIRLQPGAAMSGRVVDEFGDPLAFVLIRLLEKRAGGRYILRSRRHPIQTDDQGRFRLFGLSPGNYILSAEPDIAASTVDGRYRLLTTYHPGTANISEATVISLEFGEEASGLELRLIRGGVFTVQGRVLDSRGTAATNAIVAIMNRRVDGGYFRREAPMEPDGSFVFRNVVAGDYLLGVRTKLPEGEHAVRAERTVIPIAVHQDLHGIVIATRPAPSISGRVVMEGLVSSGDGLPAGVRVTATEVEGPASVDLFPATGSAGPDGTFVLRNVPDKALLRVSRVAGWRLKAVTVAGQDVTDRPTDFRHGEQRVQIVLTRQGASITGHVDGANVAGAATATVVLFGAERDLWFSGASTTRSTSLGADGRFTIPALRAGSYLLLAVPSAELDLQEAAPEYFEMLAAIAVPVTLAEDETRVVTLPLSQLPH